MSDRDAVMYAGRLVEVGPSTALIYGPKHLYTQLLERAAPKPKTGLEPESVQAKGELDVAAPPVGYPFAPRCVRFYPGAHAVRPELVARLEEASLA